MNRIALIALAGLATTVAASGHEPTLKNTLFAHSGPVQCAAFSSDGKLVASGSAETSL